MGRGGPATEGLQASVRRVVHALASAAYGYIRRRGPHRIKPASKLYVPKGLS